MPIDPGKAARTSLLQNEKRRQLAVVTQFERIRIRIESDLADLLRRIDIERRQDGNASPGLLLKKARFTEILDNVTAEINAASARLAAIAGASQSDAIDVAQTQAEQYPALTSELGFFDGPAVKELIDVAGDGGPLDRLFRGISKPVRLAMFEALEFGLAAGSSNAAIAREVRDAIGGGTARAMTIVRTETNRAYREATRKFYAEAPGVIGWRWLAVLDLRTCPICWALHGTVFKTKTKFGTHPNCRCTMVPVFAGEPAFITGPEHFAKLNGTQQKAILGPGRYDLYLQGANLRDFVGQIRTPFGIGRIVKRIDLTTFTPHTRTPIEPAPPIKRGAVPIARPIPPRATLPAGDVETAGRRAEPGSPVPTFGNAFDATRYMEARHPTVKFDFMRMHVDTVSKQAGEVSRLLDEFPLVLDRLKYVGTYADVAKIPRLSSGKFGGRTLAHAANDGSFVAFNTHYFGDIKRLRSVKAEGFAIGFNASPAEVATATHEFGHVIDAALQRNARKHLFGFKFDDNRTTVGHILERIYRNLRPARGELSDYALTSRAELFAESFSAHYNRPDADNPQIVRALRLIVEKLRDAELFADADAFDVETMSPDAQARAAKQYADFLAELGLKVKR